VHTLHWLDIIFRKPIMDIILIGTLFMHEIPGSNLQTNQDSTSKKACFRQRITRRNRGLKARVTG
jgi:hypothetical protein